MLSKPLTSSFSPSPHTVSLTIPRRALFSHFQMRKLRLEELSNFPSPVFFPHTPSSVYNVLAWIFGWWDSSYCSSLGLDVALSDSIPLSPNLKKCPQSLSHPHFINFFINFIAIYYYDVHSNCFLFSTNFPCNQHSMRADAFFTCLTHRDFTGPRTMLGT